MRRPKRRIGDRLADIFIAGEVAEIGHGRVAAVEHAELHQLERPDIVDQLAPAVFEAGAVRRKSILDHPLGERLGHDRPGIVEASRFANELAVIVGGGGDDPVDHGRRETRLRCRCSRPASVAQRGEAGDDAAVVSPFDGRLSQHITVNGAMPAVAAQLERLDDQAGGADRRARDGRDRGRCRDGLRVELAGRRIVAIALLGHGQRDDADARIRHRRNEFGRAALWHRARRGTSR